MHIHEGYRLIVGTILLTVWLLLPGSQSVAFAEVSLTVDKSSYSLVNKRRVGRSTYEYTYTANVVSGGDSDAVNVAATVVSSNSRTVIVDGTLTFGEVAAGTTITSSNTFSFRQNRRYPFDADALTWTVTAEEAVSDSDGDGVADVDDACPNDPAKWKTEGQCGCGVPDTDTDMDGIADCNDACPEDANKANDEGICGCGVLDTDTDMDGVADCNDACPEDANKANDEGICGCGVLDTDTDMDGVADCNDACPEDANKANDEGICGCGVLDTDTDMDGVADCYDDCPYTAGSDEGGCPLMTVTGMVSGNGGPVASAEVTIGTDSIPGDTDESGIFLIAPLSILSLADTAAGQFFPVTVNAEGFATAHSKVMYVQGQPVYSIEIILLAISDEIEEGDDVTAGVDILDGNVKVGELTIPAGALPAGTTVTGTITYLDPTTTDLDSMPGGDLLALPEGADPNDPASTVTLESFGMMEFDLQDQDGYPITELDSEATVCMKVPETMIVAEGDAIPLWWYDVEEGLWVEEGVGTVEDRADGMWMCGGVNHFTWWNYDRPVTTHSCFKFNIINEDTGVSLDNLTWQAEGISYNGISPSRSCACDGNDPAPCPAGPVNSFTVNKSTIADTQTIRIRALIQGVSYYLQSDGDGTYSLTSEPTLATSFDTPVEQGSCLQNVDVENCHFLDEIDSGSGTDPAAGNNGILPLDIDGLNFAPVVTSLNATEQTLQPLAESQLTAVTSDPDGDPVTGSWQTDCGTISADYRSGNTFYATFTAPDVMDITICDVAFTVQDDHANSRSAWISFLIIPGDLPEGEINGTVYDAGIGYDGAILTLEDTYEYDYMETVISDTGGMYGFTGIPCCRMTDYGYLEGFYGMMTIEFEHEGTPWMMQREIWMECCGDAGMGGGFAEAETDDTMNQIASALNDLVTVNEAQAIWGDDMGGQFCMYDIYLPTLWGRIQGSFWDSSQSTVNLQLESYRDYYMNYLSTNILAVDNDGDTFPDWDISVPLGELDVWDGQTGNYVSMEILADGEVRALDLGFFPGNVGGIVYDTDGLPVPNIDVTMQHPIVSTTITLADGSYSFQGIVTSGSDSISVYADMDGSGDYNPPIDTQKTGVFYASGETLLLDLGRISQSRVVGMVVDSYGIPADNMEIEISCHNYYSSTFTNGSGEYVFDEVNGILPDGDCSLYAYGYDGDDEFSYSEGQRQFSIPGGSPTEITVDMEMSNGMWYEDSCSVGGYFE